MKIKNTNFQLLEKELKSNRAMIHALEKRNDKIKAIFKQVDQILGTARIDRQVRAVGHPKAGTLTPGCLADQVMQVIVEGGEWQVQSIASRVYITTPTQVEIDKVANTCSSLMRRGMVTRIRRGVYQTKFPKKKLNIVYNEAEDETESERPEGNSAKVAEAA